MQEGEVTEKKTMHWRPVSSRLRGRPKRNGKMMLCRIYNCEDQELNKDCHE
jgi:hypothetical protein